MLLPHGYDGNGPEHSSARLERFLQMTDSDPTSKNCFLPSLPSPQNKIFLLDILIISPLCFRNPPNG